MTPRGDLIEISYGRIGATCTKITKQSEIGTKYTTARSKRDILIIRVD